MKTKEMKIEKVYYFGMSVGYHLGEWYLMKYEGYTGCVSWYLTKDSDYMNLERHLNELEWVESYRAGRQELMKRA